MGAILRLGRVNVKIYAQHVFAFSRLLRRALAELRPDPERETAPPMEFFILRGNLHHSGMSPVYKWTHECRRSRQAPTDEWYGGLIAHPV